MFNKGKLLTQRLLPRLQTHYVCPLMSAYTTPLALQADPGVWLKVRLGALNGEPNANECTRAMLTGWNND